MEPAMNLDRSIFLKCAAAVAVTGALFAATSASAGTAWSVNIGVPGVVVAEPAPIYVPPAPVYVPPAPVYVPPAPVYYRPPPPVYYRPAPVYYGAPGYYAPDYRWRHHRHHRDWDDRD
jgi:hypothetical protein